MAKEIAVFTEHPHLPKEWFVGGYTYNKDIPQERSVLLFQKDPVIGAVNFKLKRI